MQFDVFTIMIGSVALILVCAAFFFFFWMQDRRSSWLAWWIAPYACAGVAMGLYIPRGRIADLWSVGASNALLIIAFGFVWQGARVFERKRPLLWPLPATATLWLALCQLPAFLADRPMRVVLASAMCIGFLYLTYRELHLGRDEALPSRRPVLVTTLLFASVFAVRIPLAYFAPYPWGGLAEDALLLGAFNLVLLVLVAFFSVLMISMTKERREAEQRSFAMSDPLTGLLNRRAFADFAERLSRRRNGARHATALLVLDLDHFKDVNDRFGHDVGDRLLKTFAELSEQAVRASDQLFRMGGEEFCFVFPDTSLTEAIAIAERIRVSVETAVIATREGPAAATVSIGIAATQHAVEIDVLLAAADAAVYEAKARGRNRVVVAEPATLLRTPGEMAAPRLHARA